MTAQQIRPSTPRLLAGPLVLVIGAAVLWIVATMLGGRDASWPLSAAVAGAILAGGLVAWRAGAAWARWVTWGIAILLFASSAVFLLIGIWGADFYDAPVADLPGLIGLPIVGLIGASLVLWTVLRPSSR